MTNILEPNPSTIFKSPVISRRMMTFLAMVFLMIMTGPSTTHHLDLHVRAAFWTVWATPIWLTVLFVFEALRRWTKTKNQVAWFRTVMTYAIVLMPCAVMSNWITATMFPLFFAFDFENILRDAIFVAPILIVVLLEFHVTQKEKTTHFDASSLSIEPKTFFERLPPAIGVELIHIAVNDHYLEIKTSMGTEVLLMNLRQATQELSNYPGVQVHRSHWVAYDQIQRKYWQNSRLMLVMSNGDTVPVSRSFRKELLKKLGAIQPLKAT